MKILHIVFAILIAGMASDNAIAGKKAKSTQTQIVDAPKADTNNERYENLSLFQKALYFVEQNYVEEVKNKDLIYGAIKGMVETLDPHSNFLPPEIFKDMKIDTSGKFGGVGIEVGMKNSILTVITPIDDTPAYKAGIKPGDKLLKINGESTKGYNLVEAVTKMRGKKGTDVTITVWREGWQKPKDFTLRRAEIKIQSAKSEELEPGYLYVRLTNFNERSTEDVKKAMDQFENKHGKIKGLVMDLRNNPGGLLDQAVDVTSLFVDEGAVVSTKGRDKDKKEVRYAKKGMARKNFPMAVLVNGASASASEIVAGALQDHKRALILGQPTFGKGSVQTVVELTPDIGLKLTIARYYTPNDRSIQTRGIEPDVFLDDFDQKTLAEASRKQGFLREKDLKNHISVDGEDHNEFAPEEYMSRSESLASRSKESDKASEIDDKKEDKNDKPSIAPFVAKEDFQVKEALNYIKSYQTFRAAAREFHELDTVGQRATENKRSN